MHEVGEGGHGDGEGHHHHHSALGQRNVAVDHGVEQQPAHARHGEDDLHNDRAAQQPGEPDGEKGGQRDQSVRHHMAKDRLGLAQSPRPGSRNVLRGGGFDMPDRTAEVK